MTITVNTKVYNLDSHINANAAAYTGPAQTFSGKDQILLKRTAPKPNGTFLGVARSAVKLTRTITAAGVNHDAIAEVSVSVPVGAVEADVDALLADLSALLSGAVGKAVVWKHDLTH